MANSYVYDSYGRRSQVIESVIQPYSYTGREFDVESGLYFYRARYFDSETGRFLAEDPIRFRAGDQNFYRYVFNNPLNLSDPFGFVAERPSPPLGDDKLSSMPPGELKKFESELRKSGQGKEARKVEKFRKKQNLKNQQKQRTSKAPKTPKGKPCEKTTGASESESDSQSQPEATTSTERQNLEQAGEAAAAGVTAAAVRQLFLRFIVGVGVVVLGGS